MPAGTRSCTDAPRERRRRAPLDPRPGLRGAHAGSPSSPAAATTRRCTSGRYATRARSGPRHGSSPRCAVIAATESSRPPSRFGEPGSSRTPRLNVAETLLGDPSDGDALLFARTASGARSHAPSCTGWCRTSSRRCAPPASGRRPGWRRGCRTRPRSTCHARRRRIGAVFSSTSPDFGVDGVLDRFGQIEPTVLVAADGYSYGGKRFDCLRTPGRDPGRPADSRQVDGTRPVAPRAGTWDDLLAPHRGVERSHPNRCRSTTRGTCSTRRAPPACRSASSTAPAACCCSTSRSTSSTATSGRGDRVLYFTTTGWMMWNWLASVLGVGRDGRALRRLAVPSGADASVRRSPTRSASRCSACRPSSSTRSRKAGLAPGDTPRPRRAAHDLLHRLAAVARRVPRASTTRSSPTCTSRRSRAGPTCAAASSAAIPPAPVYAGEIQRPALGMAIDACPTRHGRTRRAGRARRAGVHAPRSRRCRSASGATRAASGTTHAYFERFPGVWAPRRLRLVDRARRHGHPRPQRRHAQPGRRAHRHGRDLPAGREVDPRSLEASSFGQEWDGDTRVVLLRSPAPTASTLDDELGAEIRQRVRTRVLAPPRPGGRRRCADLPRTRSNKLRRARRARRRARPPGGNTEALANPEALDAFRDLEELRS